MYSLPHVALVNGLFSKVSQTTTKKLVHVCHFNATKEQNVTIWIHYKMCLLISFLHNRLFLLSCRLFPHHYCILKILFIDLYSVTTVNSKMYTSVPLNNVHLKICIYSFHHHYLSCSYKVSFTVKVFFF